MSPSFIILKRFKIKDLRPSTRAEPRTRAKLGSGQSHTEPCSGVGLGAGLVPHRNEVSGAGFKCFYHIDCYRISKPKEILDLGFKEIISNPQNIVAIEWADRIKKILPKKISILKFDFINRNQREISMRKGTCEFAICRLAYHS